MKINASKFYEEIPDFEQDNQDQENVFDLNIQIESIKLNVASREQTGASKTCTLTCATCGCHSLNCPTVLCH